MKSTHKRINKKFRRGKGAVLWLTGLSGSGKSTIGNRLSEILEKKGIPTERLDGNLVKGCFGESLNFGKDDHDFSVKIAAFVSSVLEKHGVFVIASFISPHKHQRELVRNVSTQFIEVYINSSIEVCIKRDVKGFYKKALSGEIEYFPGFSNAYEVPKNPNLVIDTDNMDIESSVKKLLNYLSKEKYIKGSSLLMT